MTREIVFQLFSRQFENNYKCDWVSFPKPRRPSTRAGEAPSSSSSSPSSTSTTQTRITATSFGIDGVEEVAVSIDGGEQVALLLFLFYNMV